ncbi:sensor histidine kinase [Noviherbaspirillum cavernae]|nr:histidine kinase [Noviherbaspirillum cavernae]
MTAYRSTGKQEHVPDTTSAAAADDADASVLGSIRLVVAVAILATIVFDRAYPDRVSDIAWIAAAGHVVYSAVLCLASRFALPFLQGRVILWADVLWFEAIVLLTGGIHSFAFLSFNFAILAASFRWGFAEGLRMSIASTVLFCASALASTAPADVACLLLRSAILLALGGVSACWGGSHAARQRRLAMLRDASQLSNPRFGVDRTIASVLDRINTFHGGSNCILVLRDKQSGAYSLRMAVTRDAMPQADAHHVDPAIAAPLLAYAAGRVALGKRSRRPGSSATQCIVHAGGRSGWIKCDAMCNDEIADLLDAASFISVPISSPHKEGRLYVVSDERRFAGDDALFLNNIAAQAFPVIENIDLLDRMASEAAVRERHRIALDLHDTAIQPYIGLTHGLAAVRRNAAADNPLVEDLDRISAMATQVIADLRSYAATFKAGTAGMEASLLPELMQRTSHVRQFYGIDIAVNLEGDINVNGRLAAEVLQIVNEGISNICKHTLAQRGLVNLRCIDGRLDIDIENEGAAMQAPAFTPRSITERAALLGGSARVRQRASGTTAVHVEIPL